MAIHQLSDGGPDGALFGQGTTDKIGFYGLTTPIVQPSVTAAALTATTATNELGLKRLTAAMVNLGLIVTT